MVIADEDGRRAAEGLWIGGRLSAGVRPWADLVVRDLSVIPAVTGALAPGASLMIAYEGDETERALRRKVPPAATELSLAMLRAGGRWFKDWYYPEGGREGGTKLQGTLPLDDDRRRASEERHRAELEEFLNSGGGTEPDRDRARSALSIVGG